MSTGLEALGELVPEGLRDAFAVVVASLPPAEFGSLDTRVVRVNGREVAIPYRIYNPLVGERHLTPEQRLVVNCLYTRHNDGHVRERSVSALLTSPEAWTAPFIVLLLGEYVVEIVTTVQRGLAQLDPGTLHRVFGSFVAENPALMQVTLQRSISYWSCYYRWEYPTPADYPGTALLRQLSELASSDE